MKRFIYIIVLICAPVYSYAQSFQDFMHSVNENNPRLQVLQKWLEAEAVLVRTGVYPSNPQLSYNYLFGNANTIGDQQEFEITQSFKLPGYYTSKSDVQQLKYEQKQVLATKEKREILYNAQVSYFNLVSLFKIQALMKVRQEEAMHLLTLLKQGYEAGEVSKPEYDKGRIFAVGVTSEWQKVQADIKIQQQYLMQLSGDFAISKYNYPAHWQLKPLDSIQINLMTNHPDLVAAQLGIQQAEKEIKFQKMNSLPLLEAGYKSEKIMNQQLQGIHAGISIPLWQNKNKVKYAKLQTEWSKVELLQKENSFKTQISALYNEAKALQYNYEQVKLIMEEEAVSESSMQLLESGQISFSEYLVDSNLIWETKKQFIENEKAYFVLLGKIKLFE